MDGQTIKPILHVEVLGRYGEELRTTRCKLDEAIRNHTLILQNDCDFLRVFTHAFTDTFYDMFDRVCHSHGFVFEFRRVEDLEVGRINLHPFYTRPVLFTIKNLCIYPW